MMQMEHRLGQQQVQRLMLTQRMQQAIQILQLSKLELEQFVQQELEQNPVLEQDLKQVDPELPSKTESENHDETQTFDDRDFDLDSYAGEWGLPSKTGTDLSRNPDLDERRQYYENSITKEESFTSRLLAQLRMLEDPVLEDIGERIIGDIDDRGYFTGSIEEIAAEKGVALEVVEEALSRIQQFEPTGVGARDTVECLLLQINATYPNEAELKVLVSEYLGELERRQIPKIAKAMGVKPERVEELKDMLATLDPWPGHEYSLPQPQYVTPDVIVEKIEEEYVVYLTHEGIPQLHVGERYRRMARDGKVTKDEKKYIMEKVDAAKWLIRNIEQRQQTILRIANAIVDVQKDFLDKGVEAIKPLTLQEIADKVGVHEATVSRATRGKYMQTPQGLFEMKYFFSPGLKKDSGDAQSSKSVKSMIGKIIEEEDKSRPLSDQRIADMLKERGINIARRTVTKYREALGILSTSMRKEY